MDKQKKMKIIKVILGVALIWIFTVIGAVVVTSMIDLVITLFIGLALYNYTPVLARAMAYGSIKMMLWWVRENPIEELMLQQTQMGNDITTASEQIAESIAEVENYKNMVDEFSKAYPNRAEEFQSRYRQHRDACDAQIEALKQAKLELEKFKGVVREAEAYYKMSQATQRINRLLAIFDNHDPMSEIRKRTALDAVSHSGNKAMAQLRVAMALKFPEKQLQTAAV